MKNLPADHKERLARVRLSLDGLSVGDAFGQRFFMHPDVVYEVITKRVVPAGPWHYTDDTEMALSVVEGLEQHGCIDPDELALAFARRYDRAPNMGYGGTAHDILRSIHMGAAWREVAQRVFSGSGSMGNGAAMRVAPLGAYFADDVPRACAEALASAAPTHAHPDGQAGAVAVAVAAAMAWQLRAKPDGKTLLETVLTHTPDGETRQGIAKAIELREKSFSIQGAAAVLGTGYRVISSDTVPFSLFCASLYLDNYVEAMWHTVEGLGDRDTTCAIVGGIVALSAGEKSIPQDWLAARSPLVF